MAIVNADDPRALALGRRAPGRLLTFGQGPEADIRGWVRADRGLEGVLCTIVLNDTAYEVALPVLGAHQVLNALAAAAVGVAMHVPAADIVAGLQSYHGMYGRMMIRRGAVGVTLISSETSAAIEGGAVINRDDAAHANGAQSVYVNASNDVGIQTFVIGVAAVLAIFVVSRIDRNQAERFVKISGQAESDAAI